MICSRVFIVALAAAITLATRPGLAATRYFNVTTGSWTSSSQWSGGMPGYADDAQIGVSGYANPATVTLSSGAPIEAANVYLGQSASAQGTTSGAAANLIPSEAPANRPAAGSQRTAPCAARVQA